jgi:hypothetical protein
VEDRIVGIKILMRKMPSFFHCSKAGEHFFIFLQVLQLLSEFWQRIAWSPAALEGWLGLISRIAVSGWHNGWNGYIVLHCSSVVRWVRRHVRSCSCGLTSLQWCRGALRS